jgi:hypothetical protein
MTTGKKTPLEVFAEVADRLAAEHEGHDRCGQARMGRTVSDIIRNDPSRIEIVDEMAVGSDGVCVGLLLVRDKDGDIQSLEEAARQGRSACGQAGPTNVNSGAYRQGWETIFGKRLLAGEA